MTISALPDAPSRNDDPTNFASKADAFVAALATFVTETNATATAVSASQTAAATSASTATTQASNAAASAAAASASAVAAAASAASAVSAPGTSATSTTSLTIGIGSKSLTIQTGKSLVPGAFVNIAQTSSPGNWMAGTVTTYDSGTGALVVGTTVIAGSGTYTDWTISLIGAPAASLSAWQVKTTTYTAVAGDRLFIDTSGGAWTLTLPASATLGDTIELCDYAGSFADVGKNLTIARNGLVLMGLTEDMTVSTENAAFRLVYSGATYGWRLM